ncbi:MAG: sigma 54-interacting transcriptional regulator [Thermodesulfovibrionales bacterium]|nr:sigma 54-interacting transcriptional regulator [Thermodesulfovibrionales bacterium]
MLRVLIITNEPLEHFKVSSKSLDFSLTLKSVQSSEKILRDDHSLYHYDLAFIDLQLDNWREIINISIQKIPTIAFSVEDIDLAIESLKLGASNFILKPLTIEKISKAIRENQKISDTLFFDEIIGKCDAMQEVYKLINKAALSDSNVLLTGESGTGKEPVARAIHRYSPRKTKPFMTINCSAIPDTLLESELFGFEKGAFTGANYTKKGIFELADGGTILLDEIGDVSQLFQIKILRVLQEGEVMRIGGSYPTKVDLRFIAATNKDLKEALRKGLFREDLFYRLNVIHIHLPPLRERKSDIPILVSHFINKHSPKRKDLHIKGVTEVAMKALLNYNYPGNVRELENIIERAISFANNPYIYPFDLPSFLLHKTTQRKVSKLKETINKTEKELIWLALQESRGNITKAAESLGMHRQQLQRKIKSLKIAT